MEPGPWLGLVESTAGLTMRSGMTDAHRRAALHTVYRDGHRLAGEDCPGGKRILQSRSPPRSLRQHGNAEDCWLRPKEYHFGIEAKGATSRAERVGRWTELDCWT